jgi:glucose/arabinose dehydrogenase
MTVWQRCWSRLSVLMLCLFSLAVVPAEAAVPAEFADQLFVNVNAPTAFAVLPDQRMLVTQQSGQLRLVKDGVLQTTPVLNLSSVICTQSERGLLGVAAHPQFPTQPYIYLFYTRAHPTSECVQRPSGGDPFADSPSNRISRFTMQGDLIDPASEVPLIQHIPSFAGNHNGGDLAFGKDGLLYISVGDAGCDYANRNQCAGQNSAARQEHTLLGKILRINPDGTIPSSNPYASSGEVCAVTGRTSAPYAGKRCQETFAWGLRNPFRIAFDSNAATTRFFINDVGQGVWEEINEGIAGADYGWNQREGHCQNDSSTNCPAPPAGQTDPIFDYQHTGDCSADAVRGNSITGGAFVPNGIWPSDYDGDYLFGEYVCGKIFRLDYAGGSFTPLSFATNLGNSSAVHMNFATINGETALYYTTMAGGGQVRKIVYTGTRNRTPQAALSASPTSGALPLVVQFDASASSDPDGDSLQYSWDFGDGGSAPASSSPQISHSYSAIGNYTATVTVDDGKGGSGSASIQISAGNHAPVPVIEAPTPDLRYQVGQAITLRGSASDVEDGQLAGSQLEWSVILHHNEHTHPYAGPTIGISTTIVAPPPEDLLATTTSYLEIVLKARDSQQVTSVITQAIRPQLVRVSLESEPSGATLIVNDVPFQTPSSFVSWPGYELNLRADAQLSTEGVWLFPQGWQHGGEAIQSVITPAQDSSYRALFRQGFRILMPFVPRAEED